MTTFSKGDRVLHTQSKQIGTIVEVCPPRRGNQIYIVDFNGNTDSFLDSDLQPYTVYVDAFSYCKDNQYDSYEDFLLVNTTLKIKNSNDNTISSLMASKTLFKPYQFKPLLKFLNSNNRKILVADEVGLGKTIEAGHIMLELKARGELGSVLIVCPKSLQDKWKNELKSKFGITFTIYETVSDVIRDLEDRNESFKGIINYEKVRVLKNEGKKDFGTSGQSRRKSIPFFIEQKRISIDLLVCDEAHKLRNSTTQTHKGLKKIVDLAKSAVFLTATPIMIKRENLYNLLNLLDNSLFYDKTTFESSMEMNKPFVHALSALNRSDKELTEISEQLQNEEIELSYEINETPIYLPAIKTKDLYSKVPLYNKIIEDLQKKDTLELRSQLQFDLSSMSLMNGVFSRTRKKDITTDWSQAERKHHTKGVFLHEVEKEYFDKQIKEYIDDNSIIDLYDDVRMSPGKQLGLVQKKRRVASSVFGSINSIKDLDNGIDRFAEYPDSKCEQLIEIAEEVFKNTHKKLIVFALFKNTIKYLKIRLKKAGYQCVTIHGDVEMEERNRILTRFREDPSIHILLSSEVGSEGLDMQFCDSMVNYDLPWNPMVVEQRIGRIDRFGQQSPTVNIYNIVVRDSIQENIFERLLDRIGIFKDTIGDLEAILDYKLESGEYKDKSISEMISITEKELYCKNLTSEEIQRKGDVIALAIENERLHLAEIEEKLDNTLTNDVYFKNEINRIKKRNAYVSEIELRNYLEMLIKKSTLSTCRLVDFNENIAKLSIPLSDKGSLARFIKSNISTITNKENYDYAKQFANSIADERELTFTFNQEYAFQNQSVTYMNIYNPIIIAASEYFAKSFAEDTERSKTYRFKINGSLVPLEPGRYFFITYLFKITHTIFDRVRSTEKIIPIVYSIDNQKIINDTDTVDTLFGVIQSNGDYCDPNESVLDTETIEDAKVDIIKARGTIAEEQKEFYEIRMDTDKLLKKEQTEKRFKITIDNYQSYIDRLQKDYDELQYRIPDESVEKRKRELEGAIRLQTSNLVAQENLLQEALAKIERMDVSFETPEMKALCFIKID